jgi:bacterioferritin
MFEEYARQTVSAEELHAGEVDKMLCQPGAVAAFRPDARQPVEGLGSRGKRLAY